jgi:hypothetical protein
MGMPETPALSTKDRERLLSCLRRWTPGAAEMTVHSRIVDDVVATYGGLDASGICALVSDYARLHASELADLFARQRRDRRRPALLSDPALLCVLERLDHDRYALRRSWARAHDPRELRRVADLWGVRLGP